MKLISSSSGIGPKQSSNVGPVGENTASEVPKPKIGELRTWIPRFRAWSKTFFLIDIQKNSSPSMTMDAPDRNSLTFPSEKPLSYAVTLIFGFMH